MAQEKFQFILASQSPRRRELLGHLKIPFKVVVPQMEETSHFDDPIEVARDLAYQKAQCVLNELSKQNKDHFVILSSDTLVCLADKIYGKPKDIEQAKEILQDLSGKTHQVVSAYCFYLKSHSEKKYFVESVSTEVTFDSINNEQLERYLATGESLDKAGAYGIQGAALPFIDSIRGCYSNVVGLPLNRLEKHLKEFMDSYGDAPLNYLRDYFHCE